jgi:flagellar hook-length control protein FliK
LPAAPAAGAQLTASLRTPVGTGEWSQGLGQRLLVMAEQGIESARLRLNPASLGPLDIQISVDDDRAQVFFGAQQAATRDALELALPRLRELFAAQGMELVHAEVSDRHAGSGPEHGGSGGAAPDWLAAINPPVAGSDAGIQVMPDRAQGSVDIYV